MGIVKYIFSVLFVVSAFYCAAQPDPDPIPVPPPPPPVFATAKAAFACALAHESVLPVFAWVYAALALSKAALANDAVVFCDTYDALAVT